MNLVVKNDVMLQALTSTKILEMPKEIVVNQIYDMLTKAYYDSGIQSPAPKDLVLLSKAIHDEIKAYFSFLRIDELRICLANGIRGEYGEFYGINIKSIHSWIRAYQISEKRRFKLNELKSEQTIEVDKVKIEKEYWASIRSKFEKFKQTGELEIMMPIKMFRTFWNAGIISITEGQKDMYMQMAKDYYEDKASKFKVTNRVEHAQLESLKALVKSFEASNQTLAQETLVKEKAAEYALIDFFETTDGECFNR